MEPDVSILPNKLRKAVMTIRKQIKLADQEREKESITYEQYETFQELVRREVVPGGFV